MNGGSWVPVKHDKGELDRLANHWVFCFAIFFIQANTKSIVFCNAFTQLPLLFLLFFDFSCSQKPMRDRDFGRCCTLLLYECCSIIASESTQISWEKIHHDSLRVCVCSLTRKKWRRLYAYPMGKHSFTHLQVNGSCVVAFGVTKKKMWGWASLSHFPHFFFLG